MSVCKQIHGWLLFLSVLLGAELRGQIYYQTEALTAKDGLSDSRVTSFLQDRDGYMWIGTRNGLNRYDGQSFTIFRPNRSNSISNETINDLVQDDKGSIWVATLQGLNRYDPQSNHWENILPLPEANGNGLPNFIVWDIQLADSNRLWIASDVFEFSLYDPATGKFSYYDWPAFARHDKNLSGFSYRSIEKFVSRNDHELWLGTSAGLVLLDTRTHQFRFIGGGYYDDVTDIRYDRSVGKVFLSVADGTVYSYDERENRFGKELAERDAYPSTNFHRPGDNELWMASVNGLLRVSDNRRQFFLSQPVPGLQGSLLPGGVNTVFTDKRGICWVGTNNGVNKFTSSYQSVAFLPLVASSGNEETSEANSVCYDPVSDAYFASAGRANEVFVVYNTTGRIAEIKADSEGRPFTACNAIVADKAENIWLLTTSHLYKYNRRLQQFVLFPTPALDQPGYRDLTQDGDGNYWIASFRGGLLYYNTRAGKFMKPPGKDLDYPGKLTAICADQLHKRIWMGSFSDGLFCYDMVTQRLTGYFQTDSTPRYAPLNLIHDICQDAKGNIWIASHSGGIYRYEEGRPYTQCFTQFSMKDGLSSNSYISLCADGDSTLWLLSGQGVSAMSLSGRFLFDVNDKRNFSFPAYSFDDLLSHFIFYNRQKNELLVGEGGGLLFLSSQKNKQVQNYPVRITRVTLGGKDLPVAIIAGSPALDISVRNSEALFEFVALDYSNDAGIQYEYKLEGFDADWINGGTAHQAKYSHLPPGHYIFNLRARDPEGNLSLATARFVFRVAPPFWRADWFLTLIVLGVAGLLYAWISSLRQNIKEEKILNYFATSLYGLNSVDDVFWDVAKNCISQLQFEDCVIYAYDEKREVLVQKAAYGNKNPVKREIINQIEIPLDQGIVGAVAKSRIAEIVNNTSSDKRYIVDDRRRYSEIAVPILVDGKLFGVIDSEHSSRGFYRRRHLKLLEKIASICGIKISRYLLEEKLRMKIARDLHDEMGSTLTSINIISKVAMQQSADNPGIYTQLGKIKEHSSRMMESMSDMVWAIDPNNDSFERILLRMKEFAGEILEPAGINYFFREEGDIADIQFNPEQRKDIFLIYKEALNNAVKYSSATEMIITLIREEGIIRMQVMDNGNGFDAQANHSGNGLKNMQSRAAAVHAQFRIESIPGAGTTISLRIPIP